MKPNVIQITCIITLFLLTAFAQLSVNAQIITSSNVALNKPATSSSAETAGFTAMNAFDNDQNTRFSSASSDNEWISVDLGKSYLINNVVLIWQKAYAKDFDILFSVNGTFTDLNEDSLQIRNNVLLGTNIAGTNTIKAKSNTIARYVRMQGIHRATSNGYSLFEFQVSATTSVSGPLPATLVGLTAVAASNSILLDWTTTTEYNSAGFSIERSGDGSTFTTIGWVGSVNGGTVTNHYSYRDKQALTGKNYYRLRLSDLSGAIAYSSAVSANTTGSSALNAYPIPAKDHISVEYKGASGENISISLFSQSGQPVYNIKLTAQGSQQTMVINRTSNMLPGIYFLEVSASGKKQYTQQIFLQ